MATLTTKSSTKQETLEKYERSMKGRPMHSTNIKLGLQALNLPARSQLIRIAAEQLQLFTSPMEISESISIENEVEDVKETIIQAYIATGLRWMGYKPSHPKDSVAKFITLSRTYKNSNVMSRGVNEEKERQHDGAWFMVEEKLAVYSVIIRYLRHPPLPMEATEDWTETEAREKSKTTPFQIPVPAMTSSDRLSMSLAYRQRGGCLIASAVDVVEDMVISVAELVALEYLSHLPGRPSDPTESVLVMGWPLALQPSLRNTRMLERFRNQIFFGWWMHRQIHSVMAIFEDYHSLWGIREGKLIRRKCFVHRSQELASLKGWRLTMSYFLEVVDAIEPLLKSSLRRIGALISFLLVTLIGRSLGLILKGIQSSVHLPWDKPNRQQ